MNVFIFKNAQEVAQEAAKLIIEAWKKKPDLVLGLAAGRTPLNLYQSLIQAYKEKKIDFSRIKVFSLDEYAGLSQDHPLSFAFYFRQNLFNLVNLRPENIFLLNGQAENLEAHCSFYEALISQVGGIDIQILGIGLNGHIGYNEPGSSFGSRTRLQVLAPETRARERASFEARGEEPPCLALTLGLATILEAKNILLLATGEEKAQIVREALEGPLTISVPASCLQLHPSVFVFLDEPASSRLERKEFYLYSQKLALERRALLRIS